MKHYLKCPVCGSTNISVSRRVFLHTVVSHEMWYETTLECNECHAKMIAQGRDNTNEFVTMWEHYKVTRKGTSGTEPANT